VYLLCPLVRGIVSRASERGTEEATADAGAADLCWKQQEQQQQQQQLGKREISSLKRKLESWKAGGGPDAESSWAVDD
jgi:hypothetical protein